MTIPYFPRRALAFAAAGLTLGVAACSSAASGTAHSGTSAAAAGSVPSAAVTGAPEKHPGGALGQLRQVHLFRRSALIHLVTL